MPPGAPFCHGQESYPSCRHSLPAPYVSSALHSRNPERRRKNRSDGVFSGSLLHLSFQSPGRRPQGLRAWMRNRSKAESQASATRSTPAVFRPFMARQRLLSVPAYSGTECVLAESLGCLATQGFAVSALASPKGGTEPAHALVDFISPTDKDEKSYFCRDPGE